MGLVSPWMEMVDSQGGLIGGMEALLELVTTSSLDVAPFRAHYSQELCNIMMLLLNRHADRRTPLEIFLEQIKLVNAPVKPDNLFPSDEPAPATAPPRPGPRRPSRAPAAAPVAALDQEV